MVEDVSAGFPWPVFWALFLVAVLIAAMVFVARVPFLDAATARKRATLLAWVWGGSLTVFLAVQADHWLLFGLSVPVGLAWVAVLRAWLFWMVRQEEQRRAHRVGGSA